MDGKLVLDWDKIVASFSNVSYDDWKRIAETELKSPLPLTVNHGKYLLEPIGFNNLEVSTELSFAKPKLMCRLDLSIPEGYKHMAVAADLEADIVRIESEGISLLLKDDFYHTLYTHFPDDKKTKILYYFKQEDLSNKKILNFRAGYDISTRPIEMVSLDFYANSYENIERLETFAGIMKSLPKSKQKEICWHFPADSSFVFSVATYRAARKVWQKIFEDVPCRIGGYTSNYLANDLYQNLIRSTIQAASMIIGGCDEIEIEPISETDEGYRWSLNTYNLLVKESFLAQATDTVRGAPIIENLTESIFNKVLPKIVK
jgi:hypothetical protein